MAIAKQTLHATDSICQTEVKGQQNLFKKILVFLFKRFHRCCHSNKIRWKTFFFMPSGCLHSVLGLCSQPAPDTGASPPTPNPTGENN